MLLLDKVYIWEVCGLLYGTIDYWRNRRAQQKMASVLAEHPSSRLITRVPTRRQSRYSSPALSKIKGYRTNARDRHDSGDLTFGEPLSTKDMC